jgi:adenylate kinase
VQRGLEDVIRCRIRVYNSETHPLLAYYETQHKLITVPGVGEVEDVFRFTLFALRLAENAVVL